MQHLLKTEIISSLLDECLTVCGILQKIIRVIAILRDTDNFIFFSTIIRIFTKRVFLISYHEERFHNF